MLEEEKEDSGPASCSASLANRNRFNNENANNNNSLGSSKRSCPPGFDDSANTRNTYKIKPPYQPCTDCMLSQRCEPMVVERAHRLNPLHMCSIPNICVQNSGSVSADHASISSVSPLPGLRRASCSHCSPSNRANCGVSPSATLIEAYRHRQVSPMNCDELPRDPHRHLEADSMSELSEAEHKKAAVKAAKDLSLLKLSLEAEKPMVPSYVMQHQESIMQLQKAGLVRKHTKELEKLSSLSLDLSKAGSQLPEQMDTCSEEIDGMGLEEEMEVDSTSVTETYLKTSTPCGSRLDVAEPLTNDLLKTVGGLTPTSSPHGSTLTRSSSSDSLHSVRGKPGLVKQRAQEIETRLRLAGLTVSSKLKRSNSLAKLGSLTFSSEDLSSACSSSEANTILFSTSAEVSNGEGWLMSGSHTIKGSLSHGSWAKPLLGNISGFPPQS